MSEPAMASGAVDPPGSRRRRPRHAVLDDLVAAPAPERRERREGALERIVEGFAARPMAWLRPRRARLRAFARAVIAAGAALERLDDKGLADEIASVRRVLARGDGKAANLVRAFACIREATGRTLGMRHFDVQLMAGRAMLDGVIAEMATGEGKTITGLLTAIAAALQGTPVHVVTVNAYLAKRDCEGLRPVIEAFGLTCALVDHEMSPPQKRRAYAADIVFVTNKDVAFDYLRDRVALGAVRNRATLAVRRLAGDRDHAPLMLRRGLPMALVDEADLVFVDEARTPLIISRAVPEDDAAAAIYAVALEKARLLCAPTDFRVDRKKRAVTLTPAGAERTRTLTADLGGPWRARRGREELIRQALQALHVYALDRDYVIVENKVEIVDEHTGRIMPGRSWERGLHQMIETKEGAALSDRMVVEARITYQRLFRRYRLVAGMTGTVRGLETELWRVFRLRTVRVPTRRPSRRRDAAPRVFASDADRWAAVAEAACATALEAGRATLVGTRSVESSEKLAALLRRRGVATQVLNAVHDEAEAAVVAQAGQPGVITIATAMAGRGTDIALHPAVREAGGLHVIVTEPHESARIDRQLVGRAGRQGDPGSSALFAALDDDIFRAHAPVLARVCRHLMRAFALRSLGGLAGRVIVRAAQAQAERRNARLRGAMLRGDLAQENALGFAGRST